MTPNSNIRHMIESDDDIYISSDEQKSKYNDFLFKDIIDEFFQSRSNINLSISNINYNLDSTLIEDYLSQIILTSCEKTNKINNSQYLYLNPVLQISNINDKSSNDFFKCFNNDISINNSIIENKYISRELATSYMFDNEDIKKDDIYPFEEDYIIYEKKNKKSKTLLGKIGNIALMLFSGYNTS
jgi:hypothetical protein